MLEVSWGKRLFIPSLSVEAMELRNTNKGALGRHHRGGSFEQGGMGDVQTSRFQEVSCAKTLDQVLA